MTHEIAIPADAYYELTPQEVLAWCRKAAEAGYLEETREGDEHSFFVTLRGTDFLDACFRKTVHEFLSGYGAPYTAEQFTAVLAQYVQFKNAHSNPVLCIVQCLYEQHQYKQSLN